MFDGSMVANFTIGPPVLKSLRQHSSMFMDCHLAVNVGARSAPPPACRRGPCAAAALGWPARAAQRAKAGGLRACLW
jgi:hypothetical protein